MTLFCLTTIAVNLSSYLTLYRTLQFIYASNGRKEGTICFTLDGGASEKYSH